MNRFTTRWSFILVCIVTSTMLLVNSCKKKDVDKGYSPTPLTFEIPKNFPAAVYQFTNNPLTQQGFDLGRKLFYDGRLSKDGNFPCGSCHQQAAAFATIDHDLSHGFNNQFTTRNAPGLFNMAWHKEMHWDGGINHIEVQPLAPITAPNEKTEVGSLKLEVRRTIIRSIASITPTGRHPAPKHPHRTPYIKHRTSKDYWGSAKRLSFKKVESVKVPRNWVR